MGSFLQTITHWCCARAGLVLMLGLLLMLGSVWTLATKIAVVTDTDAMIDTALEYRQAYSAYQAAYPDLGDTIAVIVEGDAPELRQRIVDQLAALTANDRANFTAVYAPSALPYFKENGLLLLPYDELADQMDALVAAQPLLGPILREPTLHRLLESLAEARREAKSDDDLDRVNALLADVLKIMDATSKGEPGVLSFQKAMLGEGARPFDILTLKPILDPAKVQPAKAALQALDGHFNTAKAAAAAPVAIALTGKIALNAEELRTVSSGAATAGVLSALLVGAVLLLGVRSVRAVAAMLLNLVFGLALTGAAALWLFGSLNIISVAFAVLFIGLGIDFSIHILLRAREARGGALSNALTRAAGTSGLALAICAPTTALAFLSFTPTGYAGLAQLGAIAAVGVFIAMVTSMTLLPALLVVFNVQQTDAVLAAPKERALKSKPILIATLVALGPALYGAAHMDFEADPIALKDASAPSVVAYKKLAAREDTSPYALQIVKGSAKDAQAAAETAKQLPAVGRVVWCGSFLPKEQEDKLDLIAETYDLLAADLVSNTALATVDSAKAMAALRSLFEETSAPEIQQVLEKTAQNELVLSDLQSRLFETLPDLRKTLQSQLSTQGVSNGDVPDAVQARYRGRDGSYRVEVFPADVLTNETDLHGFIAAVRDVFPEATGSPVQIIESGTIVRTAMLQATGLAFVLVVLFLGFVLRSVIQVMFILVPVVLAGVFTLATAASIGLSFNFANVIVLPLLLGLGVDAGIHYVKRAFEGQGSDLETGTTGRAVFLSAITTIGSFGTLMVSGHDGTASMGMLLTIALCWLLVTTLIVLPALLEVFTAKRA